MEGFPRLLTLDPCTELGADGRKNWPSVVAPSLSSPTARHTSGGEAARSCASRGDGDYTSGGGGVGRYRGDT